MNRLLHIISSPRHEASRSRKITTAFVEEVSARASDVEIDVLDLWKEPVPTFDGDRVAAKMTVIGKGTPQGGEATAWESIQQVFRRFDHADAYVFGVPMWNGGIPWILKHFIDTITQPGLLFRFEPDSGYSGLLRNKTAVARVIDTRSADDGPKGAMSWDLSTLPD